MIRRAWLLVCLGILLGCALAAVGEARAQDTRPAPFGPCSAYVTSESVGQPHADGNWAVWFCADAYGVTPHWRAWRYDFRLKWPAAASTPAAAFDAFQALNMTTPADDPSLAGLRAAALAWAAKNAPPAPKWVVAKNGTTPTRPTYERKADGTKGDKTVILATVGEPCDCSSPLRRVISGTTTMCEARGPDAPLPAVVAVCSKAAP